MRYLGNKESIIEAINYLLDSKKIQKDMVFFDAFCGTGSISNALKDRFRIVLNDNLKLATTFSTGRLFKGYTHFEHLGFNPIVFFNSNENTFIGFLSSNYAPLISGRMYFSDFNAGRIDYFRKTIENWKDAKQIDTNEYNYLLSCLLESVSKVANIAGVYGAYLKAWDPRAIKKIKFLDVEGTVADHMPIIENVYNRNINEIIKDVECDILYLDPPYTKNKYSVQYHLLETLIRNDNPEISGITGGRHFKNVSDSWSSKYCVDVLFEDVIANTKASHIIVSYSSDGLMTKEYISNVLRRYGKQKTLIIYEIPYKKYRNSRTFSDDKHFEYLFYIEKKDLNDISYSCPLNYMGGKSNIIEFIKPHLEGKTKFVDLMGGGFNVGINVNHYNSIIYNDSNFIVKDLVMMFKKIDTASLLKKINRIITKYDLCKNNSENYVKYRNDYNLKYSKRGDSSIYLYTLILFGFQQQIRFNSSYEFNNPVGESGFNDSIKEKIVSFSRKIKSMNIISNSFDFEETIDLIDDNTLVYIDPPYLITLGSYNDGKRGFNGWNENEEKRLIKYIDLIKTKGCKIVISNILEYKGKTNVILSDRIKRNNAMTFNILVRGRQEVLIVYEA